MKQTLPILFLFLNILFGFGQGRLKNTVQNDKLVKRFGLALSQNIANAEVKTFLKHLKSDDFYSKVILTDNSNKTLSKFNKKFKTDYQNRVQSFPQEMVDAVKNGDFYNFVSYHFDERDKTYHLIFRYYTNGFGLDYHDYRLLKDDKGIYIDDIFVFSSNQRLSETLKLFYLSSVPKKHLSSLFKKQDFQYIFMLKNFVDARTTENFEKAQQHINTLNKSLGYKDRFVAFLRLDNANYISEETYFDCMDNILTVFPLDPNIQLIAMRYHYKNKDFDEVEKCLNSLKNYTEDTFLDFEKGNLFFAKIDYESAAIFYQNMLKNYSDFHLPKFSLLVVYERTQQFKKAKDLLDNIVETTTYSKASLISKIKRKLPNFSKSKEFKQWQKK